MKFTLPELGEGVQESELVKWHVGEGETLRQDQKIAEFMTDKAAIEVPYPHAGGKILRLLVKEGDTVKIGADLFEFEPPAGFKPAEPAAHPQPPAEPGYIRPPQGPVPPPDREMSAAPDRIKASPLVRRRAHELGIDLSTIAPSGEGGRVLLGDLDRARGLTEGPTAPVLPERVHIYNLEGDVRKPLVGLRKAILKQMVQAKSTIPHFHYLEAMDATALLRRREIDNAAAAEKRTYLPYFVKAVCAALKAYPLVHTAVDVDDRYAGQIVFRNVFNIGIAMATAEGLMVPVIQHADQKSLDELAKELRVFRDKSEHKAFRPEDMSGGTFTITSMGALGGEWATPIIRSPEVSILSIHALKEKPVVVDGKIVVRPVMNLVGAFDHRVVDGIVAAQFIHHIIRELSTPGGAP
ncbi:MAG: 2-oxo acid dehydrogenase subunit E2 [Spirochaetes bacterium]|nr:2-oxo acid dehydrogenase subunit E2 [Spirochaetota bacterium]